MNTDDFHPRHDSKPLTLSLASSAPADEDEHTS